MRKLLTNRTAISLFFFMLLGLAVYRAFDFGVAARLMPLIIGIPTFVLSAVVLGMEIVSQWQGKPKKAKGAMDGSRLGKDLSPEERRAMTRREVSVISWLIGLIVLIWLFGLLWSIPIFLVLILWLHGREPWRMVISIALGTWVVAYLLFGQILKMEFYQGFIQRLWGG
jgi:Tripartite tricarboxylate transporter TctB family